MNKPFTKNKFPSILNLLFPVRWLLILLRRFFLKLFFPEFEQQQPQAKLILEGIIYGEAPRVHNNKLYFSDFYSQKIMIVDLFNHSVQKQIGIQDDMPSGLGWLPDGRFLVVSMAKMRLLLYDENENRFNDYADLSNYSRFRCNDMAVDLKGRAYVGNFGFDIDKFVKKCSGSVTTSLVMVDVNKEVSIVATDLFFPNGIVVTPDGQTLIVAETMAGRITAFDVDKDTGQLSNRRIFADLGVPLDGMCLDAEGYLWVAIPQIGIYNTTGAVIRVGYGSRISHVYGSGSNGINDKVIACMLHTNPSTSKHYLYLLVAKTANEERAKKFGTQGSKLLALDVDVGPAVSNLSNNYNAGYC